MFKNVASQKIAVYAWDNALGVAKTGDAANITAQISKDGGASAATDDVNPTELDAANHPGTYLFDALQAESNGDLIMVTPVSSTPDIVLLPVYLYTRTVMRGTDSAALAATALTDATWTDAIAAFLDVAISSRAPSGEYNTPMARVDVAVSSRSSHSAANVWAVGARTLTGFGTLIADIWAYVTRTLTAIPTGGATEAKQNTAQADLDIITDVDGVIIGAAGATIIIDEFETQSQADPTGFHINVKEVNGTSQTANDNGADINLILAELAEVDNDGTAISHSGAMKLMLSILTALSSGGVTATLKFRDIADTKQRLSVTVDEDGNRIAVGVRDAS